MFDRLAWRRDYEHYLFGLDDEDDLEDEEFWTDTEVQRHQAQIEDADTRC